MAYQFHMGDIYECRGCDATTRDLTSWGALENIDGPNALCRECTKHPEEVLEMFRNDGYENVRVNASPGWRPFARENAMKKNKIVVDVGSMSRRALKDTLKHLREIDETRPWIDASADAASPRLSRISQRQSEPLGDPDEDVHMGCVDCGLPFNGRVAVPSENDPSRCEDCAPMDEVIERALRRLGYSATEAALMNEAAVSRIDMERGLNALARAGKIRRARVDQEVRLIREADDDEEGGDDAGGGDDAAGSALDDLTGGGDEGGGDDAAGGEGEQPQQKPDSGDSLDAQVDKYLLDYENDAKGQSQGPQAESRRRRRSRLMREAEGDDTITAAGGTSAGVTENKDIDVEKFAASVARLIENPDNMIEFKDTIMKRASNYLKKGYPSDVVDGFAKVMREQFSLEAGKSQYDMEDEFEAPRAAQAGPGGGAA